MREKFRVDIHAVPRTLSIMKKDINTVIKTRSTHGGRLTKGQQTSKEAAERHIRIKHRPSHGARRTGKDEKVNLHADKGIEKNNAPVYSGWKYKLTNTFKEQSGNACIKI